MEFEGISSAFELIRNDPFIRAVSHPDGQDNAAATRAAPALP
ncbi:hypothetical protein [Pseudomonas sp. LA21]|nr:hypothetical protein [Pseudomonas sp. LA21]